MSELSIIVPIYNVEEYLKKCLTSLVNQDLSVEEYEILLIDDGSTDSSGNIAKKFTDTHPNCHYFYQENKGQGIARNLGISMAIGEFILFVDADDYLENDILASLLKQAQYNKLDILRFNYQDVDKEGNVIQPNKSYRPFADYSEKICDGKTFLEERLGTACYPVQFLIRKDIIIDCPFAGGFYYEDAEWTPRMLVRAKRTASTGLICYNYLSRPGSTTKSNSPTKIRDKIFVIDSLLNQAEENPEIEWYRGSISNLTISVLSQLSNLPFPKQVDIVNQLKGKGIFPLSTYHCTATGKKKIRWINLSPLLFCRLNRIKRLL